MFCACSFDGGCLIGLCTSFLILYLIVLRVSGRSAIDMAGMWGEESERGPLLPEYKEVVRLVKQAMVEGSDCMCVKGGARGGAAVGFWKVGS